MENVFSLQNYEKKYLKKNNLNYSLKISNISFRNIFFNNLHTFWKFLNCFFKMLLAERSYF